MEDAMEMAWSAKSDLLLSLEDDARDDDVVGVERR